LSSGDPEEGQREHRQGDVPLPVLGVAAADLVVVQAGFVLGGPGTRTNSARIVPTGAWQVK
jgi:hypothetical protein